MREPLLAETTSLNTKLLPDWNRANCNLSVMAHARMLSLSSTSIPFSKGPGKIPVERLFYAYQMLTR